MAPSTDPVSEPFPIFALAHRYLLYDIAVITHIRANHNITGVLIGGLPQAPQQNVFLGVPLELMPEEARLLVEKGVAYIVDDVKAHKHGFLGRGGLPEEKRRAFQLSLRRQGQAEAGRAGQRTEDRKKAALEKKVEAGDWNDVPEEMLRPSSSKGSKRKPAKARPELPHSAVDGQAITLPVRGQKEAEQDEEDLLFASPMNSFPPKVALSRTPSHASLTGPEPYAVTPTTSHPPLTATPPQVAGDVSGEDALPAVPPSYPLFKHLHSNGYFLAPGLRFGCQYMAYPGDPLRFHSHFLCNGMDWDQEFELTDLVGGGRLGTGVKKGFLIGGEVKDGDAPAAAGESKLEGGEVGGAEGSVGGGKVRAFCIEWGGM